MKMEEKSKQMKMIGNYFLFLIRRIIRELVELAIILFMKLNKQKNGMTFLKVPSQLLVMDAEITLFY
ncbi:hypothetical protein BRDCF_p1978 [Bacteroidales bacterium CF]|nr:hypothetical protein BRDCF_p1978 [Bacteroidales bacterium CF]